MSAQIIPFPRPNKRLERQAELERRMAELQAFLNAWHDARKASQNDALTRP